MPGGHPPLWTLGYIQRPNICISVNFAHSIRLLRYKDFKSLSCREVFFNVDNTVSLDLDTSWVSANLDVYVRHTGYPPTFLLPRVAVKHEQYQRCIFSLGRAGRKVPLSLMNTKWLSCILTIMSSLPLPVTSLNVRVTGARSCPSPTNVGPMNILAFVPSPPGNSMIST